MQGLGQFGAAIVSLVACVGFKQSLSTANSFSECTEDCRLAVDRIWRIVLGVGAVPGFLALYFRLTIPETPRYTFDITRDVVQAGSDIRAFLAGAPNGIPDEHERVRDKRESQRSFDLPQASWTDFYNYNKKWRHGKVLLGTAGSWFFLGTYYSPN